MPNKNNIVNVKKASQNNLLMLKPLRNESRYWLGIETRFSGFLCSFLSCEESQIRIIASELFCYKTA